MQNYHIHIIDDEETLLVSLKSFFLQQGYLVTTSNTGKQGLKKIKKDQPDLVFLDLRLPDLDGLEVLENIKKIDSDIAVIMMTAYSTVETAVKAIKLGAENYIHKPFDIDELGIITQRSCEKLNLKRTAMHSALRQREDLNTHLMVFVSEKMVEICKQAKSVARDGNSTVLITGHSGTGKEVLAKLIHLESERSNQPFVVVNCGSIPHELVESELFGYVPGAFTGASRRGKVGKFEMADEGTLFLDEIGELTKSIQVKLLRFLQEKEFEKVGSNKSIKSNVRIIAATNQDLPRLIKEKKFREDLFYRLNVIYFYLPPLCDRPEDIIPLAHHFMENFNREFRKKVTRVSASTKAVLQSYHWPGNIRQLKNVIERAVLLSHNDVLKIDPSEIESLIDREKGRPFFAVDKRQPLKTVEELYITKVLQEQSGNKSKTAEVLGISRSTLKRKLGPK